MVTTWCRKALTPLLRKEILEEGIILQGIPHGEYNPEATARPSAWWKVEVSLPGCYESHYLNPAQGWHWTAELWELQLPEGYAGKVQAKPPQHLIVRNRTAARAEARQLIRLLGSHWSWCKETQARWPRKGGAKAHISWVSVFWSDLGRSRMWYALERQKLGRIWRLWAHRSGRQGTAEALMGRDWAAHFGLHCGLSWYVRLGSGWRGGKETTADALQRSLEHIELTGWQGPSERRVGCMRPSKLTKLLEPWELVQMVWDSQKTEQGQKGACALSWEEREPSEEGRESRTVKATSV